MNSLIKKLCLVATLLVLACSPYHQSIDMSWENDKATLKGTLLVPKQQPKSLVLLIPGSGSISRENAWYLVQAEKMTEMGMAEFYYDK